MATKPADQEDNKPKRATPARPRVAPVKPVKPTDGVAPAAASIAPTEPVASSSALTSTSTASGGAVAPERKPGQLRRTITWAIGGIVGIVVIVIVVFGVLIYGYRSDSAAVRMVSAVVPYPAMRVGNDFVSYHEYLFELSSIKQYYQSQASANGQTAVDFNSAAGKTQLEQLRQQIMTQLKSDEVTRQLVKQNKITVTKSELTDQFNQLEKSAGGKTQLDKVLKSVYGWNENDLKNKLKFQLASQKLQDNITNDPAADAAAKAKAEDIYKQIQAGGDFATLAKKYSQDTTAANGGDLGFFSKGQMVKAFEDVAFGQQPGQVSQPTKTQYGYHIIKTIEFNADKSQVHAAHILIKTVDFTDYLNNKIKDTKSTTFIKS